MGVRHVVVRALSLGWAERGLFARAAWWVIRAELRLRFDRSRRDLIGTGDPEPSGSYHPTPHEIDMARTYARWIDAAARYVPLREPARCLHQSIGLRDWLRAEGLPARLRIGVCLADETLQAHAWVELGGTVVNDDVAAIAPFRVLTGAGDRDDRAVAASSRPSGGPTVPSGRDR